MADSSDFEKQEKEIQARDYQRLLIDYAIHNNSIIYLPTGAGKTFVALEVIKYYKSDLEKSIDEGGKRCIFIVNTNTLALQQCKVLESVFPFKIGIFTGEKNVDSWKDQDWAEKFEEYKIIVATVQVILDAVNKNYIGIQNMNVLIFDECHHARKNHPMHQLMGKFKYISYEQRPRVIGLSGMLIAATVNLSEIIPELNQLESTFEAQIVTVNSEGEWNSVKQFSTNPQEFKIVFSSKYSDSESALFSNIQTILRDIQIKLKVFDLERYNKQNAKTLRSTQAKPLKFLSNMISNAIEQMQDLGLYGTDLCLLSLIIHFEIKKRGAECVELQLIIMHCITVIEMLHKILSKVLDLDNMSAEKILNFSSVKVRELISIVKRSFLEGSADLQTIVFVKEKYSAKLIYHLFKEYAKYDAEFKVLPDFIIGNTGCLPESIENLLNTGFNKNALDRFLRKETNCAIATNVLEEGMDIQSVNNVVMYNYPETYRSYVQSKGRARFETSKYIVMIPEAKVNKFNGNYQTYHHIDRQLKEILVTKTIDRWEVNEETIAKERAHKIKPYVTSTGTTLTELTAIPWLFRYGDSLPNDIFTNANVIFKRIDYKDGTLQVSVRLPTQSKIKHEILSDRLTCVRLAKAHAAFKACIELHKNGELDDYLLPIDSLSKIEDLNIEYFSHWDKYENDNDKKNVGLSNRRVHQIMVPEQLKDCAPQPLTKCYIYRIKVSPKFTPDVDTLKVFRKLYESECTYGILTSKTLPRLCVMKMFQSYGEIDVEIDYNPIEIELKSSAEIVLIQNFHVMIFRDMLNVWQTFYGFVGKTYLLVPLIGSRIDWDLITNFQKLQKPSDTYRCHEKPTKENLLHKVISPCYRDPSASYIVTRVHEHMTPFSKFDSDSYENYKEYFEAKYDAKIQFLDQCLVEARAIGKNFNILFPGTGSSGRSKRTERTYSHEILIPEICYNYQFPGDYWLKATLLPATLHRIQYLVHAENLRMYLLQIGIGNPHIPQIYRLDVDYGNFDEKEAVYKERELQLVTDCGDLPNFKEKLESFQSNQQKSCPVRMTDHVHDFPDINQPIPIDIDRNWLELTALDIDNYASFIIEQEKNQDGRVLRPLKADAPKDLMQITDKNRRIIKIIQVTGRTPQQKDLIKVLTTCKSHDVFDMERFEVLGDAYLKFIVSLFLYKCYADWHEGHLTALKGKLVSNRNLFYCGNDLQIPGKIKFHGFQPHQDWVPPSVGVFPSIIKLFQDKKYLLRILYDLELSDSEVMTGILEKKTENYFQQKIIRELKDAQMFVGHNDDEVDPGMLGFVEEHFLRDKIVADCMEALIGCCVESVGMAESIKLLKHLKILPPEKNLENLMSEKISPRILREATQVEINRILIDPKKFEKIIGYQFKDRTYLLEALSHPSFPRNDITQSYQQLEYLGDAVLDWLITSYVFENGPHLDPGRLTDVRSALVNNVTLGSIVVKHGLHKYLLAQNHTLQSKIINFAKYQEQKKHEISDAIELLISDQNEAIAQKIEIPKVLGDMLESLIGAVYLDSGNSLQTTWNFIYNLMEYEIANFIANPPKQIVRQLFESDKADPKFYKSERIGKEVHVPLSFKLKGKNEPNLVFGVGDNTKSARCAAAKFAVRIIHEHTEKLNLQ